MSDIRYLCLDDEKLLVSKSIARLQNQAADFKIDSEEPTDFEEQVSIITDRHRQGCLDGLLLDLRLDEKAAHGKKPVRYTATGLAAQVRSWLSTRKQEVVGFPIILWSIEGRLAHAFNADQSNKNLFDLVIYKEDFPKCVARAAEEMTGLVKGYRQISLRLKTVREFAPILNPPKTLSVDVRIGQQFGNALRSQPTHSYAHFILGSIINHPGPLIDERVLCARLGIAFDSPNKARVLKALKAAAYSGPFSEAWPRWWSQAVDDWWQSLDLESSLTRHLPVDRVAIIRKHLKITALEAATPIDSSYSPYLSTVCVATSRPIDPIDGFVVAQIDSYPWQSKRYVSRDVALDQASHGFTEKLESFEAERLRTVREKQRAHGKKGRRSPS